jgi:hypothetical protein
MESKFEAMLTAEHGFDYGQAYTNGVNIRVLFKTFLSIEYVVQLEEVAQKGYCQMTANPPALLGASPHTI